MTVHVSQVGGDACATCWVDFSALSPPSFQPAEAEIAATNTGTNRARFFQNCDCLVAFSSACCAAWSNVLRLSGTMTQITACFGGGPCCHFTSSLGASTSNQSSLTFPLSYNPSTFASGILSTGNRQPKRVSSQSCSVRGTVNEIIGHPRGRRLASQAFCQPQRGMRQPPDTRLLRLISE